MTIVKADSARQIQKARIVRITRRRDIALGIYLDIYTTLQESFARKLVAIVRVHERIDFAALAVLVGPTLRLLIFFVINLYKTDRKLMYLLPNKFVLL